MTNLKLAECKEVVSNCCGYAVIENTDLCSACKEHCAEEILEE